MARYVVYITGDTATCPECKGMMRHVGRSVDFRCNDCGTYYSCAGGYKAPRWLVYETVEKRQMAVQTGG